MGAGSVGVKGKLTGVDRSSGRRAECQKSSVTCATKDVGYFLMPVEQVSLHSLVEMFAR